MPGAAEIGRYIANDQTCQELDWARVLIAMVTCGNWDQEAKEIGILHAWLLTHHNLSQRNVIADLCGCSNLTLMRAIARAIS